MTEHILASNSNTRTKMKIDKSKIPKTFKKLYNRLRSMSPRRFIKWYNQGDGRELGWKQEGVFKLLQSLRLIQKLVDWIPCKGNYNSGSIEPIQELIEIFE